MLPTKSLISTLNRCCSSASREGTGIFRINRATPYSGLFRSAQKVGVIAPNNASYQHVKLLTSSTASSENPGQHYEPHIFQCLLDSGIPQDVSREILEKLTPVPLDTNKLSRSLNSWGACQFGHQKLLYLLTENPELILVDTSQIISSFTFLSSMFSQNYVYKLFLNCPQIVYEKRSEVSSKLDFLNKKLGIPNSQIVNSSALAHPLKHMRVRYEFLKRCGVFKIAVKDTKPTNPSLSDILDTEDEEFAKKVARLSPLEFEVFSHLYALEVLDEDENDSDSD